MNSTNLTKVSIILLATCIVWEFAQEVPELNIIMVLVFILLVSIAEPWENKK